MTSSGLKALTIAATERPRMRPASAIARRAPESPSTDSAMTSSSVSASPRLGRSRPRHQRIRIDQPGIELDHLHIGPGLFLELVTRSVREEFGRRSIKRECHIRARLVASALDGRQDQIQCGRGACDVRSEPALVAKPGGQTLLLEHRLQRVVHLGAPPQRLLEAGGADRGHHEFLDVDAGVGVCAAVEDVHHRHRKDVCVGTAEVSEQRQPRGFVWRSGIAAGWWCSADAELPGCHGIQQLLTSMLIIRR